MNAVAVPDPATPLPELLPCPFCGSDAHIGTVRYSRALDDTSWKDGSPVLEAFFGHCSRCSASFLNSVAGGFQTRLRAILAWNRRPAPAPLDPSPVSNVHPLIDPNDCVVVPIAGKIS